MLDRVETFKHLSRILLYDDSYWPAVVGDLQKARQKWVSFSCSLLWKGSEPQKYRRLYVAVVQFPLMFGSEMLVVITCILKEMGSLHNWAAHRISDRITQRLQNGGWD